MSNLQLERGDLFKILAECYNNLEQIKNNLGSFSYKNKDQRASIKYCWLLNKKGVWRNFVRILDTLQYLHHVILIKSCSWKGTLEWLLHKTNLKIQLILKIKITYLTEISYGAWKLNQSKTTHCMFLCKHKVYKHDEAQVYKMLSIF